MGIRQHEGVGPRLRVTSHDGSIEYDEPRAAVGALSLVRRVDGWTLVDDGVEGGVFRDGCRVGQLVLTVGRSVRLTAGDPDGPGLDFEVLPPVSTGARDAVLTIGRGADNDVALDDPMVSRRHAEILLGPRPTIRDLGSFNGTFVNGERVLERELAVGDQVGVGGRILRWDGSDLAARRSGSRRMLVAERLSSVTPDGVRLLDAVSVELPSSGLTAIIGPSGAGKSTLLNAIAGLVPAGRGRVLWDGHDLYRHYAELRVQIGVVPQEEILHPQLTVEQGLGFAARLRLPTDTSADERDARVADVIDRLGLTDRRGHRIGRQLSGGERKRVSIATELLTAPPVLLLDEPTSGLDPGLDRSVMEQLRGLADDDRVVVVVTHSMLGLDLCDQVVVLGRGGRLAYAGPPAGVLEHFGCADYPELFRRLEVLPGRHHRPGPTESGTIPALPRAVVPTPRPSGWQQLRTLVARDVAVTSADRALMTMLVLLPLVLAGLSRVVQGDAGLSLRAARVGKVWDGSEVGQRLTILVIAAALMGAAMTIRELVKERSILRREYAVGLSPGLYLLSKVVVLGGACFGQGIVLAWLALVGLPGPDGGGVRGWGWWEIALPVACLAATMAVVGLAASALLRAVDHAMPVLVALVMTQLVLCGAIVGVVGRPVFEQLSWLAPARWSHAAMGASVHLGRATRGEADAVRDPLQTYRPEQWTTDVLVLVLSALVAGAVAWWATRRSVRRSV